MPIKRYFHLRAAIAAVVAAAAVLLLQAEQPNRSTSIRPAEVAPEATSLAAGGFPASERALPETEVEFSIEDFCDSLSLWEIAWQYMTGDEDPLEASRKAEATIVARLDDSRDPEHLHVAALLAQDPAKKVALISRALDADPGNPLHLWGAVQICMAASADQNENRTDCPLGAWQARLIEVDGENREAWAYAAVNRFAAGDEAGALDAMRRAAASAESRVYWTETIEMLERGLAAGTDWPFMMRASGAFTVAGRSLINELRPLGLCRDQSEVSKNWAHACLAYGERNELEARIHTVHSWALAIQQYALTALGDEERLAELHERWQQLRQNRRDTFDAIGGRDVAAAANPTLFARYLQLVRERGEMEARIAFDQEAQAWVRRHQGAECIP